MTRLPCRPVGPVMLVSSQLESAYVGQRSKKLQCETEAFPRSINYWTNEGGEMITAGTLFPLTAAGSLTRISPLAKSTGRERASRGLPGWL